jgi:hypothetical protein
VTELPGGLADSTRRPRQLRVVSNGDWYMAARGALRKVGFGELALADLEAVLADLGDRVFLAHPEVKPIERYLGGLNRVPRRMRWYDRLKTPIQPTVSAVARGAQVAVVPGAGVVWVDDQRIFREGDEVPLPWTDPPVVMRVVRPRTVARAMREVIGPGGPKRAQPADEGA